MVRVLLLCVVFFCVVLRADNIFVQTAEGTGVDETELKIVGELVQNAIVQLGHKVAESSMASDYSLRVHLLKLGETYLVAVTKFKGSESPLTGQMKAFEIDDLDRVTLRITRAVIEGKKVSDDAHVGGVTKQEEKEGIERKAVLRQRYVGLGMASMSNLNANGIGYNLGLGYSWDLNKALIKLLFDLTFQGSAFMTDLGLGTYVFLSNTDTAPFIDVDFGLGLAQQDNGGLFRASTMGGFIVGGGVGVQFFRTSRINLELTGRVAAMLSMAASGSPINFTARLGVNY